MTEPSVAYLGSRSSYSHQAALKYFDPKEYCFRGQITIQDIFEAVQSSAVTRGVVPFENSTNGSVVYTLDLMCDRQSTYLDISVCGEVYVDVRHNLLGRRGSRPSASEPPKEPAAPTLTPSGLEDHSRFSSIHHIYSHPQAFGQCEIFLNRYLKHTERHDVSSTSEAAEIVSLDETRARAAISSSVAAEEYGLDILAPGIEDRTDNTTRFLIIRRGSERPEPSTRRGTSCEENKAVRGHKSLLSFTIDHQSPGALADALMVFKTHGLHLTSINSRPTQVLPWHYIFFVEFEGSEWDDDGVVKGALKDLNQKTKGWRWFGSWKDQLKGSNVLVMTEA